MRLLSSPAPPLRAKRPFSGLDWRARQKQALKDMISTAALCTLCAGGVAAALLLTSIVYSSVLAPAMVFLAAHAQAAEVIAG